MRRKRTTTSRSRQTAREGITTLLQQIEIPPTILGVGGGGAEPLKTSQQPKRNTFGSIFTHTHRRRRILLLLVSRRHTAAVRPAAGWRSSTRPPQVGTDRGRAAAGSRGARRAAGQAAAAVVKPWIGEKIPFQIRLNLSSDDVNHSFPVLMRT